MTRKILLADDSVTIQKVVELTFAEGNFQVVCVSNGKAATSRHGTSPAMQARMRTSAYCLFRGILQSCCWMLAWGSSYGLVPRV